MISLGIDFGTSGARGVVIDDRAIVTKVEYAFESSQLAADARQWQTALYCLIEQIPLELRQKIERIAIDGTSATVLLCDAAGNPIDAPLLYNDARSVSVIDKLQAIAPPHHTVLSATSSLAKLLWWEARHHNGARSDWQEVYFLHQADWLAFLLHGQLGVSDYHNALKLGYDVENLCYPNWLTNLALFPLLPRVLIPGTPVGEVTTEIATRFGLRRNCVVCAGTTDSIAAFLASGARSPGEAVTSIGSTLVLKLLSRTPVSNSTYGIYSHRLGDLWLTGGASNTGGAVLRAFFTDEELESYANEIDADKISQLDYYPLLKKGDRFPINDPQLQPRLEPRPENPVEFLHGLLESMARIEAKGYYLLQQLGATKLSCVYTAGGGAKNPTWTKIRARIMQVAIMPPVNTEAAYGTALLAQGYQH